MTSERSKAFYTKALAPLGMTLLMEPVPEAGDSAATFPSSGSPSASADPTAARTCVHAEDRETVDAFHAAALEAGGKDNGGPGVREIYHPTTTAPSFSTRTATTSRPSATPRPERRQLAGRRLSPRRLTRGTLKTAMDAEELIKQTSESVRSALDAAQRAGGRDRARGRGGGAADPRQSRGRGQGATRPGPAGAGTAGGGAACRIRATGAERRAGAAGRKAGAGTVSAEPEPREPEPAPTEPQPEKASTEELIEKLKAGGQAANAEPEPAARRRTRRPATMPARRAWWR